MGKPGAAAVLAAAALLRSKRPEVLSVAHDPGYPGSPPPVPWSGYPDASLWGPSACKNFLVGHVAPMAAQLYRENPGMWPSEPSPLTEIANAITLCGDRFGIPPGIIARTIRIESGKSFRLIAPVPLTTSAFGPGQFTKASADTCGINYFSLYWWPRGIWAIAELLRRYGWSTDPANAIARYRGGDAETKQKRVDDLFLHAQIEPVKQLNFYREDVFAGYYGGTRYNEWWTAPALQSFAAGTAKTVQG
jgi:hypothetical protein